MNAATESARITEKVLRAHFNCFRKFYLLMFSREQSKPNEYALVMEHRKVLVRANYLDGRILGGGQRGTIVLSDTVYDARQHL